MVDSGRQWSTVVDRRMVDRESTVVDSAVDRVDRVDRVDSQGSSSKGRLAGRGTAAGCPGGPAPGAGRVEQHLSFTEHYRPHSGTEMEAVSGRARALFTVR